MAIGLAFAGLAVFGGVGCRTSPRPAPVEAEAVWAAHLGNSARAPFLTQRVTTDTPIVNWSASVGSGIRGMPVVTEDVIIAAAPNERLYVISRADGSELWSQDLDGPPSPPLIRGGHIFTATEADGKLYVLDVEEGETVWDRDLPSVARPIAMSGDTVYIAAETGELIVVAVGHRREAWRQRFAGRPTTGPLLTGRWAFFVTADSIYQINREHGQRVKTIPTRGRIAGEPATDGVRIYATMERGVLTAWQLPGLEVAWTMEGFEGFMAGPALAGDAGYATSRSGLVVRFQTDDGTARVIAKVDGTVQASPSIVENGVLVGTLEGGLFFLGRDGEPRWEIELSGSILAPVIVRGDRLTVPMYGPVGGPLGTSPVRGKLVEVQ